MIERIIIIIFFLLCALCANIPSLFAQKATVQAGIYGSFMPSMGGNLDSYTQNSEFESESGIDGINRSRSGSSTSNIDRLSGAFFGIEVKAIFWEYYLARIGANYGMSLIGGEGRTVYYSTTDSDYHSLKCRYSFKEYDFPLTIGISIPFWHDSRISVSCGTAFAKAEYTNKFSSDEYDFKGKFTGWGFPLVFILEGDYFIRPDMSLTSGISYYNGRTKVIKDSEKSDGNTDFASIDFSGYRISLGVSYHFYIQ